MIIVDRFARLSNRRPEESRQMGLTDLLQCPQTAFTAHAAPLVGSCRYPSHLALTFPLSRADHPMPDEALSRPPGGEDEKARGLVKCNGGAFVSIIELRFLGRTPAGARARNALGPRVAFVEFDVKVVRSATLSCPSQPPPA